MRAAATAPTWPKWPPPDAALVSPNDLAFALRAPAFASGEGP